VKSWFPAFAFKCNLYRYTVALNTLAKVVAVDTQVGAVQVESS
jgi:hypothetical protein